MALPSTREIELETLLRKKDAQVLELTDEVSRLRQYISTQPAPSTTDPISLPPVLVSVLTPHITRAQALADTRPGGTASGSSTIGSGGNTALSALTQRAKLLQDENDELYQLLRKSETGKLKEEVKGLRRVVSRLEGALRESHNVISNLSTELERVQETLAATRNPYNPHSRPPPAGYPSSNGGGVPGVSKPPPTEPRAYKKPRLSISDSQGPGRQHQASLSPTRSTVSSAVAPPPPPVARPSGGHISGVNAIPLKRRNADSGERDVKDEGYDRQRSVLLSKSQHGGLKKEEENDARKRPRVGDDRGERDRDRASNRDRDWDRDREREKEGRDKDRDKDRGRERDRDRDRDRRRNGPGGPGGPGAGRRTSARRENGNNSYGSGDRTLAQRMGL